MAAVDYVKERGVEGKKYDAAISYVSYHLRQLRAAATIEPVATETVRGATKTLFCVTQEFAAVYGDTLAINRITSLLEKVPGEARGNRLVEQIEEIVSSTGRTMHPNG
jgi:hypothetical protein